MKSSAKVLVMTMFFLVVSVFPLQAQLSVGDAAPDFTLQSLDSGPISLSQFRGQVVFLYFFGFQCAPCFTSGPVTERDIWQVYKNQNFQALGLDIWDGDVFGVTSFRDQNGITYPVLQKASQVGNVYTGDAPDIAVVVDQQGFISYIGVDHNPDLGDVNVIKGVLDSLLGVTAINDNPQTIKGFELAQNYPNPFNPSTNIRFSLKNSQPVNLTIYDVLGRRVATLVNEKLTAGTHVVKWNGRNFHGITVASGVYVYRLKTPDFTATKKMVLLR